MIRFLHIFIFIITGIAVSGQEYNLKLDLRIPDQFFEKSEMAIPLFRLTGDSIETNQTKPGHKNFNVKVLLPDLKTCKDTAYGYIYFNGIDNSLSAGYIPFIVANYNQNIPMLLYMDINADYNFTNDGPPVEIKKPITYTDLQITNQKCPTCNYIVRLSRFTFKNNGSYYYMLEKFYKSQYPKRHFLGPIYCFREQRYNIRGTRVNIGSDSFSIGLYDGNNNGIFNDIDEDGIVIGEYRSQYVNVSVDDGTVFFKDRKNSVINHKGEIYEVMYPPTDGSSIKLIRKNEKSKPLLYKGKRISFRFRNHRDKYLTIPWFSFKHTYIYFFDWNSPSFKEDTFYLNKIYNNYTRKVKIFFLNYGKQPGLIKNYVQFSQVNYICGLSSKKINKICGVQNLPTGLYLNRFRRVKIPYILPKDLYNYLNK